MIENGVRMRFAALVGVAGMLASPVVWAQTPASPAPATPAAQPSAPGTAAPPADAGAPAGAAAPGAEPASAAATAAPAGGEAKPAAGGEAKPAEAPAEQPASIPSWFRLDVDNYGLSVWAGATHTIGSIALASDVVLSPAGTAELDIGPFFSFGPVSVNPMVGIVFDFINKQPVTMLTPELFVFVDSKPIYFEGWYFPLLNSPFTKGAQNQFYSRDFFLFYPIDDLGIGPQVELTVDLNKVAGVSADPTVPAPDDDAGLSSLQVGGTVGLNYGTGNKLYLYFGYETQQESQVNGNKLAGRFTFIHNF
jgi:hypothetical protein